MTNEESGLGATRRTPRQGIGGSPVGSWLTIALAVIAWQPEAPGVRNSSQLVSWVDNHPDAVRWDWAPGLVNPAEGVTGYVTFSPESQEGYMLIKGRHVECAPGAICSRDRHNKLRLGGGCILIYYKRD